MRDPATVIRDLEALAPQLKGGVGREIVDLASDLRKLESDAKLANACLMSMLRYATKRLEELTATGSAVTEVPR